MNSKTLFIAAFLTLASSWSFAFDCPDYADQRLISLLESIAEISEATDVLDQELARNLSGEATSLRELIGERDPLALESACRLLSSYPSLESALAESAATLGQPFAQAWLNALASPGTVSGRGGLPCLTDDEYLALRTVKGTLTIADQVAQAVCDGLACKPVLCRACNVLPAIGIVIPPFEYGLTIDGLFCGTQHSLDEEAFCQSVMGFCGAVQGSAQTLSSLELLLTGSISTTIMNLGMQVASQETLDATREFIDERSEFTSDQLDALASSIQTDDSRRRDFQADLRAIDIETALGNPSAPTPVDLQLPASVGGRLEMVREIVADAIANSLQAGLEINQALPRLRVGDTALNEGLYGKAFNAYREAYQELLP